MRGEEASNTQCVPFRPSRTSTGRGVYLVRCLPHNGRGSTIFRINANLFLFPHIFSHFHGFFVDVNRLYHTCLLIFADYLGLAWIFFGLTRIFAVYFGLGFLVYTKMTCFPLEIS